MTALTPVAFDIETTGFAIDDRVTVVGFRLPLGCRAFLQTDGRAVDADALERRVESRFDATLVASDHPTERALFDAVVTYAAESLSPREYVLVAYNAERFRGGFDLPFLRTRFARTGHPWPFADLPFADLLPIVRDLFNTTTDEGEACDLETAYETLVGGDLTTLDPFADSGEAVEAFEAAAFAPLLGHNVADVLRTAAVASVAERYCGKSDFDLKSLTPTNPGGAREG